ncbi:mycobactin polyketide synthase MbtD [Mycobacterium intermedium]|nr:mycobactin polyketide synthase MbtD [Mycobacterium intermedium]
MPDARLPDNRVPVLLSAHEEELIAKDAAAIREYLRGRGRAEATPDAVAATLLRTRRVRRHRALVRAADRSELEAGLCALADNRQHPLVTRSSQSARPRTAFVFPGQGNQWPSMGADAHRRLPAYRAEADHCADAFAAAGLPSPLPYLLDDGDRNWTQIEIQGAHFAHAASLAQVWRSCGLLPDITVGHSLGEVAAAYVAGAISLPDAVSVVAARATVVEQLPGHYGMAVLGLDAGRTAQLVTETPGWLEISVVNSTSSTAVSGDGNAVTGIVQLAERNGIFVRELAVDFPAHTSKLEQLHDMFAELLPTSSFLDTPVEFISSVHGEAVGADTRFTDYWYQNLRSTVRFDEAVATATRRGAGMYVEASADPSLLYALTELAEDALILPSGRRDQPVLQQLSASIATAALANPHYRWHDLANITDQQPLWGFPPAPMRAVYLWAKPEPLPPAPSAAPAVCYEEWEPSAAWRAGEAGRQPRTISIVASDDATVPLARQLTEAAAAHDGCATTRPDDAEITVLLAPAFLQPEVHRAADQIRGDAARVDYRQAVGPSSRCVWLVTTGGVQIPPSGPAALPAQAALAAMHHCVGFEFPDCTFAHLDLPSRSLDTDAAHRCIDVLLGDAADIALRDGAFDGSGRGEPNYFVRTVRERPDEGTESPLDEATLEHVVITGGNGTIGLRYARHCVERGAKRVTLLSRKGVSDTELARVTHGHKTQVTAPTCDITDARALSAVADQYAGSGASLLIHAAGSATFAPYDQIDDATLADVFSGKITGLLRMTEVWPLRPDVRVLLCSSVSGVWGGYGHAGYAAANRMLDMLAAELRDKGLDCTAVRWGLWQDTTIADAEEIARIERSGLVPMEPEAAITASLRRRHGDPLILAADFDRLRVFFESQKLPMPFVTAKTQASGDSPSRSESHGQRPLAELVRAEVAAAFSLDGPASVDLSATLVDLGADSVLALDLRDRLRRETGTSVPAGRILGGMTGAELVECLQSTNSAAGSAASPEAVAEPERQERLQSTRDEYH